MESAFRHNFVGRCFTTELSLVCHAIRVSLSLQIRNNRLGINGFICEKKQKRMVCMSWNSWIGSGQYGKWLHLNRQLESIHVLCRDEDMSIYILPFTFILFRSACSHSFVYKWIFSLANIFIESLPDIAPLP